MDWDQSERKTNNQTKQDIAPLGSHTRTVHTFPWPSRLCPRRPPRCPRDARSLRCPWCESARWWQWRCVASAREPQGCRPCWSDRSPPPPCPRCSRRCGPAARCSPAISEWWKLIQTEKKKWSGQSMEREHQIRKEESTLQNYLHKPFLTKIRNVDKCVKTVPGACRTRGSRCCRRTKPSDPAHGS